MDKINFEEELDANFNAMEEWGPDMDPTEALFLLCVAKLEDFVEHMSDMTIKEVRGNQGVLQEVVGYLKTFACDIDMRDYVMVDEFRRLPNQGLNHEISEHRYGADC